MEIKVPSASTLVLAGPGTGKTHYLEDLVKAIRAKDATRKILALTFSVRAAGELANRLRDAGMSPEDLGAVRTIHSFGHHILQNHGRYVGVAPGFSVYDQFAQIDVVETLIRRGEVQPPPAGAKVLLELILKVKNYGLDRAGILGAGGPEELAQARERYDQELRKLAAIDFGDMVDLPCRLFAEQPKLRSVYVKAYDFVLVDEFQDTMPGQYRLLKALFGGEKVPVIAVADDDQMIYGFNMASLATLKSFKADFEPDVKHLAVSYRCPPGVLAAAEAVIHTLKEREDRPAALESQQPDKGPCVFYQSFANPEEEADAIAVRIKAILKAEATCRVGVLARTSFQLPAIEKALATSKVPTRTLSSFSWRDDATLDLAFSTLSFIANAADQVHLRRIVTLSSPGSGAKELLKKAELGGAPLAETILASASKELSGTRDLLLHAANVRGKPAKDALATLAKAVRAAIGEDCDDESVGMFVKYAGDVLKAKPAMPLSDLVAALLADEFESLRQAGGLQAKVDLSTVHGAKGLEWDCVFLPSLIDDFFPHYRSHDSDEEMDAEKRLMYVAITRARRQLFLSSYRRSKTKAGAMRDRDPSRFIGLIKKHYEAWP